MEIRDCVAVIEVIVIEATTTGRTKISVSVAHLSSWDRVQWSHSEMGRNNRQRIPHRRRRLVAADRPKLRSRSTAAPRAASSLAQNVRQSWTEASNRTG